MIIKETDNSLTIEVDGGEYIQYEADADVLYVCGYLFEDFRTFFKFCVDELPNLDDNFMIGYVYTRVLQVTRDHIKALELINEIKRTRFLQRCLDKEPIDK